MNSHLPPKTSFFGGLFRHFTCKNDSKYPKRWTPSSNDAKRCWMTRIERHKTKPPEIIPSRFFWNNHILTNHFVITPCFSEAENHFPRSECGIIFGRKIANSGRFGPELPWISKNLGEKSGRNYSKSGLQHALANQWLQVFFEEDWKKTEWLQNSESWADAPVVVFGLENLVRIELIALAHPRLEGGRELRSLRWRRIDEKDRPALLIAHRPQAELLVDSEEVFERHAYWVNLCAQKDCFHV